MEEGSSITQTGEGEDHHHHGSGGMDMDVEVRARPSFKNKENDNERILKSSAVTVEQETTSFLQNHPRVKSVGNVSVRYHDASTIDVDVHIQMSSTTTSLNEAILFTQELRTALENKPNVREAKIYLDLDQEIPPPTSTSSSMTLPGEAETQAIMKSFEEATTTGRNNSMTSSLPWLFDTTGDVTSTDNVIKTIEMAMLNTNMTNSFFY